MGKEFTNLTEEDLCDLMCGGPEEGDGMTKEKILQTFSDIDYAYNNCSKFDTLKRMLDELTEPCEDCRTCNKWSECECGEKGHKNGTSIGYSIGGCKDYEPCEDAVSRQAVIDTTICDGIACNECSFHTLENWTHVCLLRDRVMKLPPVTPKQNMCFDGMTNGEVIKTLFPSCKTRHENTPMDNFMEFTLDGIVGYAIEKSWWNAPYKAESEKDR